MFFVFLADAMMSYLAPLFIERRLSSTFLMGVVLSTSSLAGVTSDFLIARFLPRRDHYFFSRWLIALAFFFPLSFLFLPMNPLSFFLAMAVWGVYFEFACFSQSLFVKKTVTKEYHASTWSLLHMFRMAGCILAPFLASSFLARGESVVLYAVIGCLAAAAILFRVVRSRKAMTPVIDPLDTPPVRTLREEFQVWGILFRKIWPVYLFYFAFMLLETSLATMGPFLSEQLKLLHPAGSLLLSLYLLPALFIPTLLPRLSRMIGKKRTAFVATVIGATMLAIGSWWLGTTLAYLGVVFVSAMCLALDYPAMNAVFEDYVARVGEFSHSLIGLHNTAGGFAYILGPLLAGALASWLAPHLIIGLFAAGLAVISLVVLVMTPRKIHLPQHELHDAVSQH